MFYSLFQLDQPSEEEESQGGHGFDVIPRQDQFSGILMGVRFIPSPLFLNPLYTSLVENKKSANLVQSLQS